MKAWSKELSALSDSQLVQCAAEGDSRCCTEIVVRHHTHVHNLLHYKLHNAAWEKDAEQETFIAAFSEIRSGNYHDTGHFSQYLNGIAFRQAMLIFRAEHPYVHDDTALFNDEQKEETQEEIFPGRSGNTALLRLAIKKLSPRYRQALELRDFCEMSFREIGLRMNVSEASACALHAKAKMRLKHSIENVLAQRRSSQNSRHRH